VLVSRYIGPNWVASTRRRGQNSVSETLCVLNKTRTMDNVQKRNAFIYIPSPQTFRPDWNKTIGPRLQTCECWGADLNSATSQFRDATVCSRHIQEQPFCSITKALPASYRGGLGSVPNNFMQVSWWTNLCWTTILCKFLLFSPASHRTTICLTQLPPPPQVCSTPDQAAHYHFLVSKLGTWHLTP
jgi:hypothetical protein